MRYILKCIQFGFVVDCSRILQAENEKPKRNCMFNLSLVWLGSWI